MQASVHHRCWRLWRGHWEVSGEVTWQCPTEIATKLSNNTVTLAQCGNSESRTNSSCIAFFLSSSLALTASKTGSKCRRSGKIPANKRNSVRFSAERAQGAALVTLVHNETSCPECHRSEAASLFLAPFLHLKGLVGMVPSRPAGDSESNNLFVQSITHNIQRPEPNWHVRTPG